jgi:hypothetical protein
VITPSEYAEEVQMSDATWTILALEASKTVIGAMTSSVWEQAKRSFSRLFDHQDDGRTSSVLQELERTRAELEQAREAGEANTLLPLIHARWQGRIETLFDLDASMVAQIKAFIEEYGSSTTESNDVISQRVAVKDGGTAFIVGKGTQHVYRD